MPQDWLGLVLVVFLLGMKHGIDPDHLATIDGIARFNAQRSPTLSRWSGFLFSLGHGLIVTLFATTVALNASKWSPPIWLEDLGTWISIIFLLLLGFVNLREVLCAEPDQPTRPAGIKGRFLSYFSKASHPATIAAVGAAFALSIDTFSLTALFSLSASKVAGWQFSIGTGVLFMTGMMLTDSINGVWVARLLRQTNQRALIASRVMGLSIAGLSISIAGHSMMNYFVPVVSARPENAGLLIGMGIVVILLGSFGLALKLSRKKPLL